MIEMPNLKPMRVSVKRDKLKFSSKNVYWIYKNPGHYDLCHELREKKNFTRIKT
jgi:hypothetical protein